jgi:hypothetical protein
MQMRKPSFGEANLAAVIGAVTGAMGGLFAVTIPYALRTHDVTALSAARMLGLIGFLVSTPVGWFIAGQIGPRLEGMLSERSAAIVGGILGGLVPVLGFVYWGWRLISR